MLETARDVHPTEPGDAASGIGWGQAEDPGEGVGSGGAAALAAAWIEGMPETAQLVGTGSRLVNELAYSVWGAQSAARFGDDKLINQT